MKRSYLIYLFILILIGGLYVVVQIDKPIRKPINWRPSFSKDHARPYGTQALYDLLPDLFPNQKIESVQVPTLELFQDTLLTEPTAYVVINDRYEPDPYDASYLLDFVADGNHAFLAAEDFSYALKDSLGFSVRGKFFPFMQVQDQPASKDSSRGDFMAAALRDSMGYDFSRPTLKAYFSSFDSLHSTVLAFNNDSLPNLLWVRWGAGSFILCATPYMLTNYHLLYENHHQYIAGAFSYIPSDHNLIWDEYYKVEHLMALEGGKGRSGDLRFILSQEALAWAWYLVLFGFLLYVLLEIKRKQRMIPIIKPQANLTLDFVETVGRLYFQGQNHKNVAEKKIKVLLEYIRSHYFLKTHALDTDFVKSLAAKSGISTGDIKAMVYLILRVQRSESITEDTLLDLHHLIEDFYQRSPR
jgi:hypothetical protein